MKKLCIVPILLWLSVTIAQSQNFNFSFRRNQNIAVLDIANQSLPMPWTGGINSIFVSEIVSETTVIIDPALKIPVLLTA